MVSNSEKKTGIKMNNKNLLSQEEIEIAEKRFWIHTKPVRYSLFILYKLEMIDYVQGHTRERSLFPFLVKLKNGKYICKPLELHEIAHRSSLESKEKATN